MLIKFFLMLIKFFLNPYPRVKGFGGEVDSFWLVPSEAQHALAQNVKLKCSPPPERLRFLILLKNRHSTGAVPSLKRCSPYLY